jgi:hypothetical protein
MLDSLSEAEREFLFDHSNMRHGHATFGRFRVPIPGLACNMAIRLVERKLLTGPWQSNAVSWQFHWTKLGVIVVRSYVDSLHADSDRPLPLPTGFWPGTSEKIEELRRRATLGQQLWSVEDATPRCQEAEAARR